MDTYYSRMARSVLADAATKLIDVQDYLLQASAPSYQAKRATRILAAIRNLQDEIYHTEEETP